MILAATPSPVAGVLASFCIMDMGGEEDPGSVLLRSSDEDVSVREGGGAMAAPPPTPPPADEEPPAAAGARTRQNGGQFGVVERRVRGEEANYQQQQLL